MNKLMEVAKTQVPFDINQSMVELKARYIWLTSAILNIVIPIIGIILSSIFIKYYLNGIKLAWTIFYRVILCLISLSLLIYSSKTDNALYELVFGFTYKILSQTGYFSQYFLHNIKVIIVTINILAAITPMFLLLAVCATLALPAVPYMNQDPTDIVLRMHK